MNFGQQMSWHRKISYIRFWQLNCWSSSFQRICWQWEKHRISSDSSFPSHLYILYVAKLCQDWELLCSRSLVVSQIFPRTSHRRVKVSVNKRDTRRFQHRASARPLEPTVGEYSSLLTKSFWLQCGRSEGLFLWPAGLQRNHSGLFGSCEPEGWGSIIIFIFIFSNVFFPAEGASSVSLVTLWFNFRFKLLKKMPPFLFFKLDHIYYHIQVQGIWRGTDANIHSVFLLF